MATSALQSRTDTASNCTKSPLSAIRESSNDKHFYESARELFVLRPIPEKCTIHVFPSEMKPVHGPMDISMMLLA
ncbi:MAG: hypothetical protein C4K47_10250 [Candidatus Thorarchaeota archaeon]|nr:MAG: hypothetical protein C4K47_10250 [Candidatus Thorarchaeota archaeon]